ncbi:MAG: hypothetical protein KDC54_19755 [Lewinella sp.]|nr:hypothetical protein [Lewinella sp.]
MQSPFFNQREDVLKLYDYLVAGKHLEEEKFLEKDRVYRKVYPKEPYNDAKLRQVNHFLLKQLEQYFAYTELSADRFNFPIAMLKAYRKRRIERAFHKTYNALIKAGLALPELDGAGLKHAFALRDEYASFMATVDRTQDIGLQQSIDAFDVQFIAEKLKHACLALSHEKVVRTRYESRLLDSVLQVVAENESLLTYPAVTIYYYIYLIQTKPEAESEEDYFALRQAMDEHSHLFSPTEQRDFYLMALNYCIAKVNKGFAPFWREAFEIYKYAIETKIIMEKGVLSRWTYLNAALAALRLDEYAWVEELIRDYTQYLEEQHQQNFASYCQARLFFDRKRYQEAMQLLVQFEPSDYLLNLNAKAMLLKMFYEEDEWDALDSLLESMRTYLKRKEVISYHKANYQNIVRYTKKLVRLNPFDKNQVKEFRDEVTTASPLTERNWLLEQVDRL